MKYSCLIVDDEISIAQAICEYFNMFDVPSAYVTDYEAGLEFLKNNQADLILLDVNLDSAGPAGHTGFEFCKTLRQTTDIPVFFLSARTGDDDVLTALNLGGDDYIKKPCSLNILLAKVKALLRRMAGSEQKEQEEDSGRRVELDTKRHGVLVEGTPVRLKEMEYKLLAYLMEHPGQVVTKEEIFANVWRDSFVGEGTLTVHIRYLRKKIEKDPDKPRYIKTVWGVGYVFEVE